MYLKYFGLREPSFSIAPDPEYLYLSEQHREALAHLLYGASESGGFVLLTGEVGTGKTTVCRAFLDQLPDEVDVALVLNPAVSGVELLRTICEEFHIPFPPAERSTKHLIGLLNLYLLEAHAKGRRPVLMIDEAQALRPRVLELVRLLTNLETNKQKLLQIFLVGQPELRRLIDSDEMRQLSQRITARYHLGPLTAAETAAYVRHRLAVAGVDRPLFTRRTVRRIHALSGGVPRLVNILCDRALLGACVERALQVTPGIVARAARELRGEAAPKRRLGRWLGPPRPAFVMALGLTGLLWGGWQLQGWLAEGGDEAARRWLVVRLGGVPDSAQDWSQPPAVPVAADPAALAPAPEMSPEVAPEATAAPVISPPPELRTLALDRSQALRVLLRRWGVEVSDLGARGDPCERIAAFGLRCETEQGTWGNVRFFNRPVLLALDGDLASSGYLALGALAGDLATLDLPDGHIQVPLSALDGLWRGDYVLIWQPPPFGTPVIRPGSSREAVRWLRQLLAQVPDLGFTDVDSDGFDAGLTGALRRFQSGRGLAPDGIAGHRTLIQLNNAVAMPGIPKLAEVP